MSIVVELNYTVHYNYEGILDICLHDNLLVDNDFKKLIKECANNEDVNDHVKVHKHQKMNSLPSCRQNGRQKPTYSLFRIDISMNDSVMLCSSWVTSRCLEFLDAKDNLYKYIELGGESTTMPTTLLLPHDLEEMKPHNVLYPCLLKGALGSGGFGIYFVRDDNDVVSIMRFHHNKAKQTDGFLDNLIKDFGRVPSWSLQELIPSARIQGNKRCQIRVYIVVCENHCYFYHTHEVRLPTWACNLDDELTVGRELFPKQHSLSYNDASQELSSVSQELSSVSQELSSVSQELSSVSQELSSVSQELSLYDKECCLGTTARPYNKDRNKKETLRYLASEIEELESSSKAVNECIIRSFKALQPFIHDEIINQNNNDDNSTRNKLAIAGVDLVLTKEDNNEYKALIVELNNNPSMVSLNKKMSAQFNSHLKQLLSDIILLGLSKGQINKNFSMIW